jgi:small subunit ribosomal protein S16
VIVAVVIRMKKMGRKHRAFFRICATDKRSPRDGRVIESLGTYDPSVSETDARCTLNHARVQHWLSVGAKPSDNVSVLIKKYGPDGTHLKQMEEARARLSMPRAVPEAGPPAPVPEPPKAEEQPTADASSEETAADSAATAKEETSDSTDATAEATASDASDKASEAKSPSESEQSSGS